MFANIFAVIHLLLKLIGAWEAFLDYSDAKRKADNEEKRQKREAAVDESTKAETEDEIWKSQEEINRNSR